MKQSLFGQWMKHRREEAGITRAWLAAQVHCADTTLRNIECNQQRPSQALTLRLLTALSVTPADRAAILQLARLQAPPAAQPAGTGLRQATTPTNLPVSLTSFVGRETDLAALHDLLARQQLISIVGPGGVGKTRVAIHLARRHLAGYPDGVWFVPLAGLEQAGEITPAIITTLGLAGMGHQSPWKHLVHTLQSQQTLIILDTCEHLLAACASLSKALIDACPRLTVLVTSREALNLEDEAIYRLEPLPVPPADPTHPDYLANNQSVQFFLERARSGNARWALTPAWMAAAARICRKLDGLPLALELATARLRVLTLEELEQRLDQPSLSVLGGPTSATQRHQTLAALVGWSYQFLSEVEQLLFRRLAVFNGGWTLEILEAVWDEPQTSVAGVLRGLVDKSLVVQTTSGTATIRYRMLDTIRAFAWTALRATSEEVAIRDRHCHAYLTLVEAGTPHLLGPMGPTWHAHLNSELDNLHSALRWCLSQPTATMAVPAPGSMTRLEAAMRLCNALWRIWDYYGYYSDGAVWLEQTTRLYDAARSAGLPTPAADLQAQCWLSAGNLALSHGALTVAHDAFSQSLACSREIDYQSGMIQAINGLSWGLIRRGLEQEALDMLQESIALARSNNDLFSLAQALNAAGAATERLGDLKAARILYNESLGIFQRSNHQHGYMVLLNNLAGLALRSDDLSTAAMLLTETLAHRQVQQHHTKTALILSNLGLVRWLQSQFTESYSLFQQAWVIIRQHRHQLILINILIGLASCKAAFGATAPAAEKAALWDTAIWLLGFAEAAAAAIDLNIKGPYQRPFETVSAMIQEYLGERAFQDRRAAGNAASLDEVIQVIDQSALLAAGPGHGPPHA
ncbi:MAG TPA: helix-turn-helix domain-containing protein [Herpetosiphonaceae bacterium]|nr:helix-turn-helix domain-containing protein [Herpetosiphonaceae bacterium]